VRRCRHHYKEYVEHLHYDKKKPQCKVQGLKPFTICAVIAREERSHRPVLTRPTSQAPAALHKQHLLAGRP
jgi:hypothetical protein